MPPPKVLAGDYTLSSLLGYEIESLRAPGTFYRLERVLGAGGMSTAHRALCHGAWGDMGCVIKFVQPSFLVNKPELARLVVEKEATALIQLNQRTPPTPFVVKIFDAGSLFVQMDLGPVLELPWLALEYVHGGPDGTTLSERVKNSIKITQYAFDAERTMRAIECLSAGLDAVHELGVVHRDVKPDNILCCGYGDEELFKVSDFGIARPSSMASTFGGVVVGTPGYAAPEQMDGTAKHVGPWSDVFSMGSLIFYMLTGQDYFQSASAINVIVAIADKKRRSILTVGTLDPDLRNRPKLCNEIDAVLAKATSLKTEERPASAKRLAAELTPLLRPDSRKSPLSARTLSTTLAATRQGEDRTEQLSRNWFLRNLGHPTMTIRSVGWSSDGTCLVATTSGLSFWDGSHWSQFSTDKLPSPSGVHVVQSLAPGRWVIGGEQGMLAELHGSEIARIISVGDTSTTVTMASGEMTDLSVMVVLSKKGPPTLYAMSGLRWLRPVPLDGVSMVTSVVRLSDTRWIIAGRSVSGLGYAAVYDPLMVAVYPLEVPQIRSFLAAAANHHREAAVMAGTDGVIAWFENQAVKFEQIPEQSPVTAVSVNLSLQAWAATPGKLWVRDGAPVNQWRNVWRRDEMLAPFVSIYASMGHVVAVTADGGIVEGRSNAGW